MAKHSIKIVLAVEKVIQGKKRKAETVLLNGDCVGKCTADDLSKAIQLGEVKVVAAAESKPADENNNTEGQQ